MTDELFNKLIDFTVFGKCVIPLTPEAEEFISLSIEKYSKSFFISEKCLVPVSDRSKDYIQDKAEGEVLDFDEIKTRDLPFHRCYMSLLGFIWDEMPLIFRKHVPKPFFYKWLKHLKKLYNVLYRFRDEEKRQWIAETLTEKKKELRLTKNQIKAISILLDRTDLIEYESISFGRMNDVRFKEYIREQLPFIYTEVLGRFYGDDLLQEKINKIEKEYKKFFKKLEK